MHTKFESENEKGRELERPSSTWQNNTRRDHKEIR
jgi:hypothetical protein